MTLLEILDAAVFWADGQGINLDKTPVSTIRVDACSSVDELEFYLDPVLGLEITSS